uniref:N-acetyltransferase domain-containing protein n=1 Tax=Bostrychia simpliciuscula TaxID=324754 RepID=A0A1Z1M7B9_9FLOR|nr:hypothetical protein [Bostrychia simpliciuscula]ARW61987.1 hypothetical protein [Bostrychia simpliciuscula]
MEFWNLFFNSNNNNKKNSKKLSTKKVLLIKNLNNNNKTLNIYLSINNEINVYELEKLCDAVGWVKRPLKKVRIALNNSFLTISIFYYINNKKKLIGFARATSDNSFNATIWDVVIHPNFQGKGLGKILMKQTIKQLRQYDISTITLFADPQVIKFYRHLGFLIDPDGVKGMFWYPA